MGEVKKHVLFVPVYGMYVIDRDIEGGALRSYVCTTYIYIQHASKISCMPTYIYIIPTKILKITCMLDNGHTASQ